MRMLAFKIMDSPSKLSHLLRCLGFANNTVEISCWWVCLRGMVIVASLGTLPTSVFSQTFVSE